MKVSSLKDVTVLDCSTLLPGPYCTMMLAELGATVVKVERFPSGDPMREVMPGCFEYLNGNKKSIALDLKRKEGLELFLKLAVKARVVVEGFRPGVAKRLGIDFDAVKNVNPSIIYCSITGYGQTGPYADFPGHDINYQGLTGLFSISGDPESGPEFPYGFQVADISGAMFALTSIVAALSRPEDDGSATYLDVSLTESLAMWMIPRFLEYLDQKCPSKKQFMGRGPYGIFQTRDGRFLTLGVVEDHFWENLCKALDLGDLAGDDSLRGWVQRNRQRDKIVPRLRAAIEENDLACWLRKLAKADVPVAPVNDFDNWFKDAQMKERGFVPTNNDGSVIPENMPRYPVGALVRDQNEVRKKPTLGRDTNFVLNTIGLDSEKIGILRKKKVI